MVDPCSICYQELSKANNCVVHPCQHEFCKECIYKLKASNKFKFKCPLCRANIVSVFNVSMRKLTFFSKIPSFDLPWENSIDKEKLLKFKAKGREVAKFLKSLEQLIQTVKGKNNFWNRELLQTCSWRFLRFIYVGKNNWYSET